MKKPLISIIIPVYNVEEYLRQSLESIINQTIGLENLQVIMIDDCSTDKSRNIMDEYSDKYSNFISIKMDTCSGMAGKPRNEGLKIVEADYIMFLDSDDSFHEKACENMYNTIIKTKADMVTANYIYTDEEGNVYDKPVFNRNEIKSFVLNDEEFIKSFFILNNAIWNKIFKTEYIKKYNLKFLEGVPAEDAHFMFSYFLKAKKVYYLDEIIYYYRRRNVMTLSASWNRNKQYFDSINIAFKAVSDLFRKEDRLDYYKYYYAKNLTSMIYKFIDSTQINDEERRTLLNKMHWFYEESVELDVIPCQESLKILIDGIIERKYDEVIRICKIVAEIRRYITEEQRDDMSKPKETFYTTKV